MSVRSGIGVTSGLGDWHFQDNHVERLLDNAAYTSAHPDDTLILVGPARYGMATEGKQFEDQLLAVGMMQGFSAGQNKPTQPMMAIGSGRSFYVSGKAQTNWNMQRMFVNGRNLLRALSTMAVQAGIDVSSFDDPAANSGHSEQFYVNLDSELFLIPFGMAVLFRDKVHGNIGAFYMEACMINSWQIGLNAGGNMIAEAVSGMADRVLPIYPGKYNGVTNASYPGGQPDNNTTAQELNDKVLITKSSAGLGLDSY